MYFLEFLEGKKISKIANNKKILENIEISISSEKIIMPIPSVVKLKSYIFLKR